MRMLVPDGGLLLQAKKEAAIRPAEKARKSGVATFSINASSLRSSPVAPAAPVSAQKYEETPSAAALRRASSNGTANTMSIDGGGECDDVSSATTASTGESGR